MEKVCFLKTMGFISLPSRHLVFFPIQCGWPFLRVDHAYDFKAYRLCGSAETPNTYEENCSFPSFDVLNKISKSYWILLY